ncbi:MAG: bifunctional diaminohydroxyphosphoribosylaminopyrimidine deaminase/5-amino-6-(5-phosphoribosylamino)uracil reductase RibD [Planctomycetota bacterium]|nr:bifunctional diaminohydroxyphosphoribosylaminopyrimidine deaminase/5-amino-6-(5-phosphoribosylamino)uracil reductase RibD [Planctomycetota bacterium]MDG1984668.1 bifunctional diaminohydroxyphosphoribosylaminopyrimidine deaminase/5-amino-6-(5-phosphoribosylamino)uracil reductase RibD [Planctomycetota bacterium]
MSLPVVYDRGPSQRTETMNGVTPSIDPAQARELLARLGEDARRFRFEVAPNPCVGAAILSGGRVVSRGFHRVWGGPHAEVDAIARADASGVPRSDWDTMVVTLEPCSSSGKTGPCVQAILEAGIQRVIVGAEDPDQRHRGVGLEQLRSAGVEVFLDPVPAPLARVAPHFLRWSDHDRVRRPRPWTVAKWAQTLTGQLSPPAGIGDGRWISGGASLEEVQTLRGRVDAIVTGVGTVLADDPRLTLRRSEVRLPGDVLQVLPLGEEPPRARPEPCAPARVILDSWLRTPPDARLFGSMESGEEGGPVRIVTLPGADPIRRRALEAVGAEIHMARGAKRHSLDLRGVWSWLWEQGYRRVMLECGPTLLRNTLEAGFVDQLRVYTGEVRGGEGESLAGWLVEASLEERLQRESGSDAVLEAFHG